MLGSVFTKILSMSTTASMIIIGILLIRLLLSRAPKVFSYMLWMVVLFRLVCPFTVSSEFGILSENDKSISLITAQNLSNTNIEKINLISSPEVIKVSRVTDFNDILGYIWLFISVCLILYNLITYFSLKKRLVKSIHLENNIYANDIIESPFVFGLFSPKIYLPAYLSDDEKSYVIYHEKIHIKRFDHITRILAFFALSIHWFNPLVWLSYRLSEIDMEMSCDEAVLKHLGSDIKKSYSNSLLSISTGKRTLRASITLPFASSDTGKRVKNVLNYKKPTLIVTLLLLIIIGASILIFGVNNNKTYDINLGSNKESSTITDIYQYRTKYIGDNSKIGNIIYRLSFPEAFSYKAFELKTAKEPYGLIIEFEMDSELDMQLKRDHRNPLFYKNALLIFSLVENCDYVSYSIDLGEESPYLLEYDIDWARRILGEEPWSKSKNEESFNEYYEYVLSMYFIEDSINTEFDEIEVDSGVKIFKTYKDIEDIKNDYNKAEIPSGVEPGNRYYTDIYGETRFLTIRVVSENGNTSDFTLFYDTKEKKIWTNLEYISGPEYQYENLIKLIDEDSFYSLFE